MTSVDILRIKKFKIPEAKYLPEEKTTMVISTNPVRFNGLKKNPATLFCPSLIQINTFQSSIYGASSFEVMTIL